ncbi:unnamed protein product [Vitrella brassicaformis CCMP3155]|uniref:DNA-directed RNA polymerase III subunit RPC3 n=4 Tax=Vitrella brassicaformis TaxID=1169539 RepID=A0A0G4H3L6_VITBC|nr:unnamed protein product [Vitrella brassicaformis CCMP3155]|eukprot:CEM38310.1 unnamed protein product [Vitrella brassicaformis CCMP3155]
MLAEELSLALALLEEHFGPLVKCVAECLLTRGPSPLSDLLVFTRLPWTQCRNAILVLIQHNCVRIQDDSQFIDDSGTAAASADAVAPPIVYAADLDEILVRQRFARFLLYVEEMRDEQEQGRGAMARLVLEEVMKHGRMKMRRSIDAALKTSEVLPELAGQEDDNEDEMDLHGPSAAQDSQLIRVKRFEEEFLWLVSHTMLCRADPARPKERQTRRAEDEQPDEPTSPAKRGGGRKRAAQKKDKGKATATSSKRRKGKKGDAVRSLRHEEDAEDHPMGAEWPEDQYGDAAVEGKGGRRRKGDKRGVAAQLQAIEDKGWVYRVNSRFLTLELAKDMVQRFALVRTTRLASIIVKALLTTVRMIGQKHVETSALTFEQLEQRCESYLRGGSAMQQTTKTPSKAMQHRTQMLQALERLVKHPDQIVVKRDTLHGDDPVTTYQLMWDNAHRAVQSRVVFNAVKARVGLAGARVYTLLAQGAKHDDKKIGELCLLPPKTCREALNALLVNGWAAIQDVGRPPGSGSAGTSGGGGGTQRAGGDAAANKGYTTKSFNIFTVRESEVRELVLRDVLKTAANMRARLDKESKQLLTAFLRSDRSMTDEEQESLSARQLAEDQLECHLLHLDKTILILKDFNHSID